jgi:hypothetical protein
MTAETTSPPADAIDDPEVAFAAMSRKLAGLTAAVEGFAARQQDLHARDYGPDLAKIFERLEKMKDAILTLNERPAMQLTPEKIGFQIRAAGDQSRASDHQAWGIANQQLGNATQSLNSIAASARAAETQRLWLAGATGVALVIGFALGAIIPTKIAQAVPESWHWPETKASSILQRDGWSAGERLLQISDPDRWKALIGAERLGARNVEALAHCGQRGRKVRDCRSDH